MRPYAVVYEKAAANWAAYVPDLLGCITTGATLEETKRNIREAQRARPVSRCAPADLGCGFRGARNGGDLV
jgi:hypothetical protein